MAETSRIRGVIFDVDGTLVDSNDAHAQAWCDAFAEHGLSGRFDQVRPLIGMGGDKLLPRVTGISEETSEGSRLSKRRGEIFKTKYLSGLRPFPGSKELVQRLRDGGFRLAVASSAKEDELEPLLDKAGVEDLLEKRTSSDDAERSKPDPDIVHAAWKKLDLPKEEVVMIGDTPYDVEAARRLGIAAIAFRCGGWKDADLAGAAAVYDGPADLLEKWETSLFAKR